MKALLLVVTAALFVCPVSAQETPAAENADSAISVWECGDPNIVFGAGPSAWLSTKLGWLGELVSGLPSKKAGQYRAGLEAVLRDADATQEVLNGLRLRDQMSISEWQTADALIMWNAFLDNRQRLALACLKDREIPSVLFDECTAELRAVRRARTNLPCTEDLKRKQELLRALPPIAWRNASGWERATMTITFVPTDNDR